MRINLVPFGCPFIIFYMNRLYTLLIVQISLMTEMILHTKYISILVLK